MSNFGVVFANENEMSDFEPVPTSFLNKPTYKKKLNKKDRYHDPYAMPPTEVKMGHFMDMRNYNPDYEHGWSVQRFVARKKYYQWLRNVRRTPGWENFRRAPPVKKQDEYSNNDSFVIRKNVPNSQNGGRQQGELVVKKDGGKNKNNHLAPQSRVKGTLQGDDEFKPKMFTDKMGKYIAGLRHNLKLTQADLGKKINVDANTIRDIELGNKVLFNSDDTMVIKLAKVLGVPSIKYQE